MNIAIKRVLWLGLFWAALLAGPVPAQDNQWVTVNPGFHTPVEYPEATLSSYNGWASLKYNTRDSVVIAWRMILDSRRHNGIYANALVTWNVEQNRLDLITASNYAGGTYDPAPSFTLMPEFAADITPCPRHPYDALAYVDSTHSVYMLLGATPRIVNFEPSPSVTPQDVWDAHERDGLSTWKFSLAEGRWHRIPENIRKFWPSPYYCQSCVPFHDNHLVHWKSAHKLLFVESRGIHAAVMDLERESWDSLALENHSPFDLSAALSAWDSKRERVIFRAGDSVCYFDPAVRRFTSLPNAGLDQGPNRAMYTGIAYVASRDVYLAVGRDGLTRVFHPETGEWSTVASGDIGLSPDEDNLQLEYDPATDQVVLSTHGSGDLGGFRTFRYRPSVGVKPKTHREKKQLGVFRKGPGVLSLQLTGVEGEASIALINLQGRTTAELRSHGAALSKGVDWKCGGIPAGLYQIRVRVQGHVFTALRMISP